MESALRSLILTRIILMESTPHQDSKTKAGVAWSSTINSFPVGLSPPLPPPPQKEIKIKRIITKPIIFPCLFLT